MSTARLIIYLMVIFMLERVLPFFVLFPILFFPSFAIISLSRSRNYLRDAMIIMSASLLFDLFSGLTFGILSGMIFLMVVAIFLIKKEFTLDNISFIGLIFFTLFLTQIIYGINFIFLELPIKYFLSELPVLIIESLAVILIFSLFFGKKVVRT